MKNNGKIKRILSLAMGTLMACTVMYSPVKTNAADTVGINDIVSAGEMLLKPGTQITFNDTTYLNVRLVTYIDDGDSSAVTDELLFPQSSAAPQYRLYINTTVSDGSAPPSMELVTGESTSNNERGAVPVGSYTIPSESGYNYYVKVSNIYESPVISQVDEYNGSTWISEGNQARSNPLADKPIINLTITRKKAYHVTFEMSDFGDTDLNEVMEKGLFNDTVAQIKDQKGNALEGWLINGDHPVERNTMNFDLLADYDPSINIFVKAVKAVSPVKTFSIPDTPYGQAIKPVLVVNPPFEASSAEIQYFAGNKETNPDAAGAPITPKEVGTYTAVVTVSRPSFDALEYAYATCTFKIVKASGSGNVTMGSYIFGGAASKPTATSSTNDAASATFTYKAAGAGDSAYSASVPTAVGNYVVKATFPENSHYNSCSATANFKISYLPADKSMYILDGNVNADGWYSDKVFIKPASGYEISLNNRSSFSTGGIELNDATPNAYFYIKKTATGEQTDVIMQTDCKIDMTNPQFTDWKEETRFFAGEDDKYAVQVKEKNVKQILVNDKEVKSFNTVGDNIVFTIDVVPKPTEFTVKVVDMAGNVTEKVFEIAPAWMETGIVKEGTLYFEENVEYTLPSGQWDIGDGTTYASGKCYTSKEGEYNCSAK